jgi:thymidylate synthase ThyX
MQPSAKIIADSINEEGNRLTTLEVVMHRFVLAEFNTHRAFSRNSASSRAIPINKQIDKVLNDPAIPLSWGKNQKGMQAEEELDIESATAAKMNWLVARDMAVDQALILSKLGVHKQIVNRLLEPFLWHTAIVSSTEWDNFFMQRCSPLAQPEIQAVAYAISIAINDSLPNKLKQGDWHLPYISTHELQITSELHSDVIDILRKVSVARCARVSYLTHDGERDIKEDLKMYERLAAALPPHSSPFEHVATPDTNVTKYNKEIFGGNFKGWTQMRHMVFGR